MATSGVTQWSLTVSEICHAAARELGAIGISDSLSADEISACILHLNAMLKSWSTEANMFRENTGTVFVTGGAGSGALPQEVRDVSDVRFVNPDGSERPLARFVRGQWMQIPTKATFGAPTVYYYQQGVGQDTLFIWPVPEDDAQLRVDYSRVAETVTDASETVDIPQEWQEAVIKGLAARVANMFGSVSTDPNTVQKVTAEAQALYGKLLDSDRPDSYIMQPWGWDYA